MSNDRLREALDDLAYDVNAVDLRDRIHRTSHAMAVRRTVVSSAAALILVAAAATGAIAATSHSDQAGPIPATSLSPSPTSLPSATSSPSPTPSTAARTTPDSTPVRQTHTQAPAAPTGSVGKITGTTYWLQSGGLGTLMADHGNVVNGSARQQTLNFPTGSACANETMSISPDGTLAAWVTSGMDVYVAHTDGSHVKNVGQAGVPCSSARILWWTDTYFTVGPDTTWQYIGVDAATATIKGPDARDGVTVEAVSLNGVWIACHDAQTGARFVTNLDGTVVHDYTYTPSASQTDSTTWVATGVSNDGAYVAVGPPNTNPSYRQFHSTALIKVATNQVVDLSIPGTTEFIGFVSNGDIVVTSLITAGAWQYTLMDSSLHIIGKQTYQGSSDPFRKQTYQGGTDPWQGAFVRYVP